MPGSAGDLEMSHTPLSASLWCGEQTVCVNHAKEGWEEHLLINSFVYQGFYSIDLLPGKKKAKHGTM